MEQYLLLCSIPVFLIFFIGELFILIRRKSGGFDWRDSAASISLGLGYLFVSAAGAAIAHPIFTFLFRYRLTDWSPTVLNYVVFIFFEDLAYYWFHRISHICRLGWASHETHHSSRFYNFSTAVRQTWTGPIYTWIFWAPLPLLGFPVEWIAIQAAVSLIYQYFLHTELVQKLGPLEWVFNTPSHHRVHHGTDPDYLDRNYAGIFVIWDRIFGTFTPEGKRPVYGVTRSVDTFNPFKISLGLWVDILRFLKNSNSWKARVQYVFLSPSWKPDHSTEMARPTSN